jgi:hypothetical protein
MTLNDCVLQQF